MSYLINPFRFGGGAQPIVAPLSFVNLDAETGDMTGWTVVRSGFAVRTVASGYPAASQGTYYWAQSTSADAAVYQDHTLTADEIVAVDAGVQWISLLHDVRGVIVDSPVNSDAGRVWLEFRDGGGSTIGTLSAVAPYVGPGQSWGTVSLTGLVPPGTRVVRLHMAQEGYRNGMTSDFYVDDVRVAWIAEPAPSEPWFVNLDAELGTFGWEFGSNGFVASIWSGIPAHGGANYFLACTAANCSLSQTVEIAPSRHGAIDAGVQDIDLGWWERFTGADTGQVTLQFLDASNSVLDSIGSSVAGGPESWVQRSFSGTLPASTRKLRLVLNAVRQQGVANDFYVDDIAVAWA